MKNNPFPVAVVGILIGFVVGFFTAQALGPLQTAPVPQQAAAQPPSTPALPEDHPSPEFIEQLQAMQQRAQDHADDAQIRVTLGNAYYDMGRFDTAIRWYEEAVALDPSDVNVLTDLGTAYFYSGNPQKAIAFFEQSLGLQPDHPQTLQNLGWVQFQSDNLKEAIQAWEKLIETHPNYENIEAVRKQLEVARAHLRGEHS